MTLLVPTALFALAALAVPVAIHLWSRGEGPRVQVGSLRFIEDAARQQARRLRPERLPLLTVRCALLAALALLLAGLARTTDDEPTAAEPPAALALVDPAAPRLPDTTVQRALDSLARAGADLRALRPGLPPLDADAANPSGEASSVWSLLRMAHREAPPGTPLVVVAAPRRAELRGKRPVLPRAVTWIDAPPADTLRRWIEDARRVGPNAVHAVVATSTPSATRRIRLTRPTDALASDDPPLAFDGDTLRLVAPDAPSPGRGAARVLAPTDTLRVALRHGDARARDARYVAAAVRTAAAYARRPLALSVAAIDTSVASDADVAVWLAAAPVPDALAARVPDGLHLVSDAKGTEGSAVRRRIVLGPDLPQAALALRRRTKTPSVADAVTRWTDDTGAPLLTRTRNGDGRHDRFASRFHPTWTNLPLDPVFPEAWLRLLSLGGSQTDGSRADDGGFADAPDLRRVALRHARPARADANALAPVAADARTGPRAAAADRLDGPLWLLAFALFALERWLARR